MRFPKSAGFGRAFDYCSTSAKEFLFYATISTSNMVTAAWAAAIFEANIKISPSRKKGEIFDSLYSSSNAPVYSW